VGNHPGLPGPEPLGAPRAAGEGDAWTMRGRPPGKKPWITREGAPALCGWIGPGDGVMGTQNADHGSVIGRPADDHARLIKD